MATIRDVAKRAAVAPMTVSRVINQPEAVAPETRDRVEAAIRELRYIPNRLGQGLRNKQTMTIALVVSDISNPFAISQVLGVSKAARAHGYDVIFAHTNSSPQEELAQLRNLIERRVDGIVLSPVLNTPDATRFVQQQGLPIVVLDYPMPDNDVDIVRCDGLAAAHELTELLLEKGHRRIAMLSGPQEIVTAAERASGYSEAMSAACLAPDVRQGPFTLAGGYDMAREALGVKPRPTALVTANNFIALGAARAASDMGISIPEELSIVTFDGVTKDLVVDPFFTGVVQPVKELSSLATDMLLERVTGVYDGPGREVVLPTRLDVHTSVLSHHD